MAVKTFDPNQLTISIGAHIASGFSPDTMLTVEMADVVFNTAVDANGNSYRYKVNNNDGIVTLSILDGSPTNNVLSTFYNTDRQTNAGTFYFMIKDNLGSTLIESAGAYVESVPPVSFGTDVNTRDWVIRITNAGWFVGGFSQ